MSRSNAPRQGKPVAPEDKSDSAHFLPLGRQMEEVISVLMVVIGSMPRAQKPILGNQLSASAWTLMEHLTRAGRKFHKQNTLQEAVIELDLLCVKLRCAHGQRFISGGQYHHLSRLLAEVGMGVGGWYRAQKAAKSGKCATSVAV
ncbi:MAG: hypothetical protein ACRCYV_01560 [Aeromonas sp.]